MRPKSSPRIPEGSVARDTQEIPYRLTGAYRVNAEIARGQRKDMRFRRECLWPSEAGQRTSALMRSWRGPGSSGA